MKIIFFSFPSNILIKKNSRAALGDMGHSKLTQRSGAGGSFNRASKSKSIFLSKNIIFGTEGYLAPETLKRTFIIEDGENDSYFAIDVWLVVLFVFIFKIRVEIIDKIKKGFWRCLILNDYIKATL